MKKKNPTVFMIFCLSLLVATGCWDRIELNDQAIFLGLGIDLTQDGAYQASAQFVIPSKLAAGESGGGGKGENFFVETGSGKTIYDALQKMQTKISRRIFRSHRETIYIGERLARHGIRDILDMFTRDSDLKIRANISVIKGNQALDALKISYPFETTSAQASLKMHDRMGVTANTTLLDFLKTSASESSSPGMAAFELVSPSSSQESQVQDQKKLQFAGSAIFDKNLKLVGFLNDNETKDNMWILGRLSHQAITAFIPNGDGKVSLEMRYLKSKIQPMMQGNKMKIDITLSGEGDVRYNNTNFDLTQSNKVKVLEDELEKYYEKRVLRLINKVQKKYGTDIFEFGDTIFRRDPDQWEQIKNEWEKKFQEADVSVKADFTIHLIGLTGSPEHAKIKESKTKK